MPQLMGNCSIYRLERSHMYRDSFSRQHSRQDGGASCTRGSSRNRNRSRDIFHGSDSTCACCAAQPQPQPQPQPPHPCPPPTVRQQPCPSIPWPRPQTFMDDTSFCPPALLPPASVQFGAMNCDMQSAPPLYALPQCCCMPTMPHGRPQASMRPPALQICSRPEPRSPERSFDNAQSCSFGNDNVYLMQSPTPACKVPQSSCKQSPPMCSRPTPDSRCQTPMRPPPPKICSSPGGRTQRRCFSNGQGGQSGGRKCHPDAYPVPVLTRQMEMDPLGPRCDFGEAPQATCPPVPTNESMRSLQPVGEALNEPINEPFDRYYHHPGTSRRAPAMDPVANFDLDRFDRDQRGGIGRRRNVSIRTCIDYDYEPITAHENAPRPRHYPENQPSKQGCGPRSQLPPGKSMPCVVKFPSGSDETVQPNAIYFPNHPQQTAGATVARRRNVTVRRCVDYDEEPN